MLTEQQIDAAVRRHRYEPSRFGSYYEWFPGLAGDSKRCVLPMRIYDALPQRREGGFGIYPTREAAFADLRRAIALSNTQTT